MTYICKKCAADTTFWTIMPFWTTAFWKIGPFLCKFLTQKSLQTTCYYRKTIKPIKETFSLLKTTKKMKFNTDYGLVDVLFDQ